jgi:hypothetical protein
MPVPLRRKLPDCCKNTANKTLSNDSERLTTPGAEAKNRKVIIQRGSTLNAQPVHHSETGAIDDGKVLVAPGKPNLPRSFKIGQTDRLNDRYAASQTFPEALSGIRPEAVVEQRPCFDQHVIGRHQCFACFEYGFGAGVAPVG